MKNLKQRNNSVILDIGKTHIKIILFDTINFKELVTYQTKNKILDTTPYPHFDLEFMKSFIITSLKKISKEFPVDTIFTSTHGACLVLLGKDKLILPVLDYEHDGPDEVRSEYDKTRLPFHLSGTPAMPAGLNLGAQIYWLNKGFPDEFAKVDTILFWPQYWSYWLCGVVASEISYASSHSDLWNINENKFIDLKNYEISPKVNFPNIKPASEILGPIKKNLAQEMGLSEDVMIYCGGHDSSLTLASAYLKFELPVTVISTGTWITVFSIGKKSINIKEQKGVMISCDCFRNKIPNFRFPGGKIYENNLKTVNKLKNMKLGLNSSDIDLINFEDIEGAKFIDNKSNKEIKLDEFNYEGVEHTISEVLAKKTLLGLEMIEADGKILLSGPFIKNKSYLSMIKNNWKNSVIIEDDYLGLCNGIANLINN